MKKKTASKTKEVAQELKKGARVIKSTSTDVKGGQSKAVIKRV